MNLNDKIEQWVHAYSPQMEHPPDHPQCRCIAYNPQNVTVTVGGHTLQGFDAAGDFNVVLAAPIEDVVITGSVRLDDESPEPFAPASGKQLDALGELYGVDRSILEGDCAYRERVLGSMRPPAPDDELRTPSDGLQKDYQEMQRGCGLEVGDWVRVISDAKPGDGGWCPNRAHGRARMGDFGKVVNVYEIGIRLGIRDDDGEFVSLATEPCFALEKVAAPPRDGEPIPQGMFRNPINGRDCWL